MTKGVASGFIHRTPLLTKPKHCSDYRTIFAQSIYDLDITKSYNGENLLQMLIYYSMTVSCQTDGARHLCQMSADVMWKYDLYDKNDFTSALYNGMYKMNISSNLISLALSSIYSAALLGVDISESLIYLDSVKSSSITAEAVISNISSSCSFF